MHPGGLTALMTAYLTFVALRDRVIRLEQTIPSPPEAEIPPGPRIFLGAQGASVKELLEGVLVLAAQKRGERRKARALLF